MTYSQKQEKAINRLTYNSRNYLGLIVHTHHSTIKKSVQRKIKNSAQKSQIHTVVFIINTVVYKIHTVVSIIHTVDLRFLRTVF